MNTLEKFYNSPFCNFQPALLLRDKLPTEEKH